MGRSPVADLEADLAAGRRASFVSVGDDAFKAAVEAVRVEYHRHWENSPARDVEGREALRIAIGVLNKVVSHLETVAAGGKIAKQQIDQLNEKRKRGIVERFRATGT